MTQSVAILGRQPALGMAELESLFGAGALQPLGSQAALIDVAASEVDFKRLGGVIKLAQLLTILPTINWADIESWLIKTAPEHTVYIPDGKMDIGLSVYDLNINAARINATALSLKKALRAGGRSARIVPNKTPDLSSAQVLHNNLVGPRGWEFLIIRKGGKTYVAQTTDVQDINAYAARDQKRPKRDARVGMLPPKLAQIIVNLAHPFSAKDGLMSEQNVLDPFCGTGVVLQEALLMGFGTYGTDLDSRMIDYSRANLDWLGEKHDLSDRNYLLETGDATDFQWQSFDTIACETYLGRPFSAIPALDVLTQVMQDVDTIHRKFLRNLRHQTKPGFRMCIAVPAWKTKNGFKHLNMLDSLAELGYTRTVFSHAELSQLIYHRPEQIVARELVVLTRN